MILLFIIGIILLLHSCATESSIKDTFLLQPTDTYLNFPIDEDTRLPKYCLWTFEDAGKEYLAFPNGGKEILFYDIESESLLKKVNICSKEWMELGIFTVLPLLILIIFIYQV